MAALAAVGAWIQAARSATAAERSANAAEKTAQEERRANYLASAPDIILHTDGRLQYGLDIVLTSDRDLDWLTVELAEEPLGMFDRQDFVTFREVHVDQLGGVRLGLHPSGDPLGTRLLGVAAGKGYRISLIPMVTSGMQAHQARGTLRMTACVGEEEWTIIRSFGPLELKQPF